MATARGEEFVIASGSDQVPERLAAALEPRFTVVRETRRRARQVWLDTFDGRLHAAGLALRQVAGAGSGELVLSTSAGTDVACEPLRDDEVAPPARCHPGGPAARPAGAGGRDPRPAAAGPGRGDADRAAGTQPAAEDGRAHHRGCRVAGAPGARRPAHPAGHRSGSRLPDGRGTGRAAAHRGRRVRAEPAPGLRVRARDDRAASRRCRGHRRDHAVPRHARPGRPGRRAAPAGRHDHGQRELRHRGRGHRVPA